MEPTELKFAESHEWVQLDSTSQIATIGISAIAVEALTDLVYMDLPKVGSRVTSGKPFGEVESVKATSDLYSPVDGEIVEVNQSLPDNLDVLSHDPYGQGWIIKVKVDDAQAVDKLLDYQTYQQQNEH